MYLNHNLRKSLKISLALIGVCSMFFLMLRRDNTRDIIQILAYNDDGSYDPDNLCSNEDKLAKLINKTFGFFPLNMRIDQNDAVLAGNEETIDLPKRFLSIGISSVWRKEKYLFQTLDSLFNQISNNEKNDIYIFLLLADKDPNLRKNRTTGIENRYKEYIDSSLLHVLQPPSSFQPKINYTGIRRTFGDDITRVKWRTKQVIDFAFLFWYTWVKNCSHYHLLLEDDILSAKHYVTGIKDFVQINSDFHWVALEFSKFLGIGKLLRTEDLNRLVLVLLQFYMERPVDMLLAEFINLMVPDKSPRGKSISRTPGLFQHIGVKSTLVTKTTNLKDKTFGTVQRRFFHFNPEAYLYTTIKQDTNFASHPIMAYSAAPGEFHGILKENDTFDILFHKPQNLTRLFISAKVKSILKESSWNGHVEISDHFQKLETSSKLQCENFQYLTEFENDEIDFKYFTNFTTKIECVRIIIDEIGTSAKFVIKEIAIFTT